MSSCLINARRLFIGTVPAPLRQVILWLAQTVASVQALQANAPPQLRAYSRVVAYDSPCNG